MKQSNVQVFNIDPRKIDVMEGFNKRVDFGDIDELAAQIKEQGLLEAITVVPYKKEETDDERYLLVNGERRYRALMKLINDGEDVGLVRANFLDVEKDQISDTDLYIQQYMRNEGKKFNKEERPLNKSESRELRWLLPNHGEEFKKVQGKKQRREMKRVL